MKKCITPFFLLLCAVVLFLGARLPKSVAAVQDHVDINQVRYAPISEVHLEFDDSLTIKEKLAVKENANSNVPVPAKLCSRTQENILTLAQEALEEYVEAGLLPFDVDVRGQMSDCRAFLAYDYYAESSFVFWDLVLSDSEWSDWVILLTIDDETGTILSIQFGSNPDPIYALPLDEKLETFCTLYKENLGTEFSEYDEAYYKKNTESTTDGRDMFVLLNWWDPDYGKVAVQLSLHEYGFSSFVTVP